MSGSATHVFSDRIINVAVTGPLIRLELGVFEPAKAKGQKPQLVPSQTLVMPLDGFLQSFATLEGMVKKFIADGVVKRVEADQKTPSAPV